MTEHGPGPSYWTDRTGHDQCLEDKATLTATVERLLDERDALALVVAEQRAALEGIRDSLGYERGDEVWQVADEALATPQPEAIERAAALMEAADALVHLLNVQVAMDEDEAQALERVPDEIRDDEYLEDVQVVENRITEQMNAISTYRRLRQGHGGEGRDGR